MPTILVLNGPNLNLLGTREPEQYGTDTLADIDKRLIAIGQKQGCQVETLQSNAEVELVERIHQALGNTDFIIINPAALTHTSVALRDALLGVEIPFIEVHLSNIHSRETFRHKSFLSDVAVGVISGLGAKSYELALSAAIERLNT